MTDPRKATVAAGYDAMAARYVEWAGSVDGDPRDDEVAHLAAHLPQGARVLDLGCGSGVPTTRQLATRCAVTGVDLSAAQVELARHNVPNAEFRQGDLVSLRFPPATFDAVVALYSITHVPREEHAGLFRRIASWLTPGGLFLASLSAGDSPDWTGEWLGVPMFFSGWDAATNRRLLRAAGFRLERDDVRTIREPEGDASFLWVLGVAGG